MTSMFIESVVIAFVLGGIVGIAIALSLRSSRAWSTRPGETPVAHPVHVRGDDGIHRRRR